MLHIARFPDWYIEKFGKPNSKNNYKGKSQIAHPSQGIHTNSIPVVRANNAIVNNSSMEPPSAHSVSTHLNQAERLFQDLQLINGHLFLLYLVTTLMSLRVFMVRPIFLGLLIRGVQIMLRDICKV